MKFADAEKLMSKFYESHALDEEPDWEENPELGEDPDEDDEDTAEKSDFQRTLDLDTAPLETMLKEFFKSRG